MAALVISATVMVTLALPEGYLMSMKRDSARRGWVYEGIHVDLPQQDSLGRTITPAAYPELLVLSSQSCCGKDLFPFASVVKSSPRPLIVIWDSGGATLFKANPDLLRDEEHRYIFEGMEWVTPKELFAQAPVLVELDSDGRIARVEPASSRREGR